MPENPFSLEGQIVLVSGAGRGIGFECAKLIAAAGATVALTARTAEQVETAAETINAAGGCAFAYPADAGAIEDHDDLLNRVEAEAGVLTGFVSVAGVSPSFARAETLTPAHFDEMVRINQRGTFFLTTAVARRWLERGTGGAIVIVSSVLAYTGAARLSAYAMTRGAVEAMAKSFAAEWAHAPAQPIRVNCVAPGWVASDFTSQLPAWYVERNEMHTAMRRFAQPDETAGAVVYLLSDAARNVTGASLEVSGGWAKWSLDAPPSSHA